MTTSNLKLEKLKEAFLKTLAEKVNTISYLWKQIDNKWDAKNFKALQDNIFQIMNNANSFEFSDVAIRAKSIHQKLFNTNNEYFFQQHSKVLEYEIAFLNELCKKKSTDNTIIINAKNDDQEEFLHSMVKEKFYNILIVDDEPSVANFHSNILQEVGMETLIIETTVEIDRCILTFRPDLILLDFFIPGVDTVQFVKYFREKTSCVAIPVIFISGNSTPDNKLRAFQVGADDFIEKPIHPDYLISIIKSRIQRVQDLINIKNTTSLSLQNTKNTLQTTKNSGKKIKSTQKITLPINDEKFPNSIIDHILRKFLLVYNLMTLSDLKDIIKEQKAFRNAERFIRLDSLILHKKIIPETIIHNLLMLKNPEGKSIIEGFEATHILAEGGMGLVYSGFRCSDQNRVAIKVFCPKDGSENIDLQRFIRECELAKSLNHKGITKAYKFGKFKVLYYIVMEYVDGINLSEKIATLKHIEEEEALNIFGEILEAMSFAWKKNIIHRDIKPDNIMISSSGIKICDLGLAKAVNSNSHLTQDNVILGTPYYMSPEQCMGKNLDYRTDVYSLGVTLYSMLTGEVPFQGNFLEVTQGHMTKYPLNPTELDIHLSESTLSFLWQLLEKIPENRCSSIDNLLKDFHNVHMGKNPHSKNILAVKRKIHKYTRVCFLIFFTLISCMGVFWTYKEIQKNQKIKNINAIFSSGKHREVINLSTKFLLKNSENVETLRLLAKSYLFLQKYRKAEEVFSDLLALVPKDTSSLEGKSQSLYFQGIKNNDEIFFRESLFFIKRALEIKENENLLYLKARILRKQKKKQEAIQNLKKIITFNSNYWKAYYLLGILDEKSWFYKIKLGESSGELNNLINYSIGISLLDKNNEQAKAHLLKAFQFFKKEEIAYSLGMLFFANKKYQKCISFLNQKLANFKTNNFAEYNIDIVNYLLLEEDRLHALAVAYFYQNQNDKSMNELNKVIKLNDKKESAFFLRFQIYKKKNQHKNALCELKYIISNFSNSKKYKFEEAKCLFSLKKSKEALVLLNDLVAQEYSLSNVLLLQIKILFSLKKYEKISILITKYMQLFPNNIDILMFRGELFEIKNQLNLAIENYQTIIDRKPNITAYKKLINIFFQTKKYLSVVNIVNKIFRENQNTKLRFYRGVAYFNLGRKQEALRDLKSVVRLKNTKITKINKATCNYYIAIIYFEQNYLDKSKKTFELVLKTMPKGKMADSAMSYLQKIKND